MKFHGLRFPGAGGFIHDSGSPKKSKPAPLNWAMERLPQLRRGWALMGLLHCKSPHPV
jgi:hypothetical protein